MRDVFADFLPRHAVNVYLGRKQHIVDVRPAEMDHWNAKCLKVICILRQNEKKKETAQKKAIRRNMKFFLTLGEAVMVSSQNKTAGVKYFHLKELYMLCNADL